MELMSLNNSKELSQRTQELHQYPAGDEGQRSYTNVPNSVTNQYHGIGQSILR